MSHAGAAEPQVLAPARIAAEVDHFVVDSRAQPRGTELAVPVLGDVEAHQRGARGAGDALACGGEQLEGEAAPSWATRGSGSDR